MQIALSLVGLTFLTVQCRSRAVGENDRHQYPVETLLYQPVDHRSIKQERALQQVSRAPEQYQYQYETESSYPQETQYETSYAGRPTNQITLGRPNQGKQLPTVEQYLKEVTPTTKTAYDPSNFKPVTENKRVQYTYRAESQQQPLYQQHSEEPPKGAPVAQNILAYQNARIAQQNAIYEQQRVDQLLKEQQQQRQQQQQQQGALPHSDIYISQTIQKSPPVPVQKVVKPKPSSLDEEIEYYTKLQYEQQQLKDQNSAYERKQPAAVKYQDRIPQNSNPESLPIDEQQSYLYQPEIQYHVPAQHEKATSQPKEQVYLSDIKYQKKIVYQPQNEQVKYYEQPQVVHYHVQPTTYESSDQNGVRYQESAAKPIQASEEGLQKYGANIVKYHSLQAGKATKVRQQIQPQYVQEEHTPPPQSYQAQQYAEQQPTQTQQPAYLGPTDEEYKQSEFKQSIGRNSSLRVLKTGKPVVFIGHEE